MSATYQPEDCGRCNATGIDRFQQAKTKDARCPACYGQGSVLVAQPARKCAICGGTGEDRSRQGDVAVCMTCFGTTWAHREHKTSS